MRILNPFSGVELKHVPKTCPKLIDMSQFRVTEICESFQAKHSINKDPTALFRTATNQVVVVKLIEKWLGLLTLGEDEWRIVANIDDYRVFSSVINFKGSMYVLDSGGKCVVLDSSLNISHIDALTTPRCTTGPKYLVESRGELLAVEKFTNSYHFTPTPDEYTDTSTFCFVVHKLDESEKKWHRVTDLGDWVLVVGPNFSYSVSASEFRGLKGNTIFNLDKFYDYLHDGEHVHGHRSDEDVYEELRKRSCWEPIVFDVGGKHVRRLVFCPEYGGNVFWPPPAWFSSPSPIQRLKDMVIEKFMPAYKFFANLSSD